MLSDTTAARSNTTWPPRRGDDAKAFPAIVEDEMRAVPLAVGTSPRSPTMAVTVVFDTVAVTPDLTPTVARLSTSEDPSSRSRRARWTAYATGHHLS